MASVVVPVTTVLPETVSPVVLALPSVVCPVTFNVPLDVRAVLNVPFVPKKLVEK